MGFDRQAFFSTIHLKHGAIAMCLDGADADLRILRNYAFYGIKNYQAYISSEPPPFPGSKPSCESQPSPSHRRKNS